jgi:hypothetical protein
MTIVVEDGSIVTGANSYGTEAGLTTYASARGITIPTADREQYLIQAMDIIEYVDFGGIKYTKAQPLQFPREGLVIDGYEIDVDEIPNDLIESQYEAAIAVYQGNSPLAVRERLVKRVQVGSISKEYADGGTEYATPNALYNKLAKLLGSGYNNGFEFSVTHA